MSQSTGTEYYCTRHGKLISQDEIWKAQWTSSRRPHHTLPMVPEGDAVGTNPVTTTEKELEAKLLPPSGRGRSDSDVELVEVDSNVELLAGPGDGDAGGEEGDEL